MDDMGQIGHWIQAAGEHHARGDLGPAEQLYGQVLARDPTRVEALCGMAVLLSQTGRHAAALAHYPREIVLRSGSTLLLVGMAGSMLAEGDAEGAVPVLKQALAVDPTCPEAHNTLGAALLAQGRILDAVLALRAALQHRPAYPEAFYNLGRTLYAGDMPGEAVGAYEAAIRCRPGYAQAFLNKGFALRELGKLDEAATAFRMAMTVRPGYAEAMHNLGVTLAEQGQAATGVAWLRRAVETDPGNALAHSGLVYLMLFDPACSTEDLATEARRWNQRHGAGLQVADTFLANGRDPHRRLKVGFVSPDFRAHAECRFMLPLLAHLDSTQFEVHCYSSVRKPDEVTERLRRLAHVWHDVEEVSDARLAERIREDGIDILIDLTMHMENHRLGVFARRPAPLQMSWLAYPGVTGLETMDYHLTDRVLFPPGAEGGAERPLYVPDAWFCYQAAEGLPEVAELPALAKGHVTFGSMNTFRKVSTEVLGLWAKLLAGVAGSRLILITPEGSHRQGVADFLHTQGIEAGVGGAAGRVEMIAPLPYAEYMGMCRRIDIGLDPFPHAGATTTLDLLNMGVPVLTLTGGTPAGRLGASILTTAGLEEWVAASAEEYVAKGVRWAGDLARLANVRAGLREKVGRSALMDGPRFARHFGQALQGAWQTWCEGH